MMKTNLIFKIFSLIFVIAVASLVIRQPMVFAQNLAAATDRAPATAIAQVDQSEIGSTDDILLMGIVIVMIIIAPLSFYKTRNSNQKKIR